MYSITHFNLDTVGKPCSTSAKIGLYGNNLGAYRWAMARPGGKDRGLFQRRGDTKTWWIRWVCHHGHDHQERAGTKSFARQLHAERRRQVREQQFCLQELRDKRRQRDETKMEYISEQYLLWARRNRPRSIGYATTAMNHLVAYFGEMHITKISKLDIERFMQHCLDHGMAPASINRCRTVLSAMYNKCIDWELCESNPCKGMHGLREDNISPRPITEEEEEKLFAVLPEHLQPIVTLSLHTGLRMGELRLQRWADVDLIDATLTVTRPKSGKREVLPLNGVALALLAGLPQTHDVIFPQMPVSMSRSFTRYVAKAGLPSDITFHCLRDTYISRLAPYCAAPTLMRLARHRDFATTQRYLRVDERHLRQAVERLEKRDGTKEARYSANKSKYDTHT